MCVYIYIYIHTHICLFTPHLAMLWTTAKETTTLRTQCPREICGKTARMFSQQLLKANSCSWNDFKFRCRWSGHRSIMSQVISHRIVFEEWSTHRSSTNEHELCTNFSRTVHELFTNKQPAHYTHAFTNRSRTTAHEQRVFPSKDLLGHS